MSVENAQIDSTHLGIEDHGILTAWVMTKAGAIHQGFGGFGFDYRPDGKEWVPSKLLAAFVRGVIDAVGVSCWEKLKGSYCRVKRHEGNGFNAPIYAIGHITEDKWYEPAASRWWKEVVEGSEGRQ